MNQKASEMVGLVGVISPNAIAAGTVNSGWIDAGKFHRYMAVVLAGTLGSSATLDAKIRIASDSSGTGAEDCTGRAITQLVKASHDDKQAIINIKPEDLVGATLSFKAGTATHFRLTAVVATATSGAGGVVLGVGPRLGLATDNDVTSIVEVVG